MLTNKSKDSSHKPIDIAGDEDKQLFVLERLTLTRKKINVHKLHVPDLDALILNRVEALERNFLGRKRDQDNAVQKTVGETTSADRHKYSFGGKGDQKTAVQNVIEEVTSTAQQTYNLSRGLAVVTMSHGKQWYLKVIHITFDEGKRMYSVVPVPGFEGFTFSPDDVGNIKLVDGLRIELRMSGELQCVQLLFARAGIADAKELAGRLEKQTGLSVQVERIEGETEL